MMSACSSHVPLPPLHQYIKPTNPLISLYPNPQTNTTLSINKTNQHKKERKTMDLYGSFSTPSDCLHIDDFLDFSNITTDTHHHLPPPQNSPLISHDDANLFFNFPSVPVTLLLPLLILSLHLFKLKCYYYVLVFTFIYIVQSILIYTL